MAKRESLLGDNIITLSICYQHLAASINRALEPLELNMTQLSILTHFVHRPERYFTTVTQLSKAMQMNQPVVTKSIKALNNQGLIEKTVGKEDARVSYLVLSSLGRERLVEAQQACLPVMENAYDDLTSKELEQLVTLLSKVKDRVS